MLPAGRFWSALDACGAAGQARYLERAALALDPRHTLDIAASIADAMRCAPVAEMAAADATAAFAALGPPPLVCRSSAAMEDGPDAAFSGVYVSVLGLGSPAALAGAIAECWRSACSPTAIRYLLRMGTGPVDLGLAVLLQRQVQAGWYGVYVSADPLTGAPEPLADLSDAGPEVLVAGAGVRLRAARRDGRWTGVDACPAIGRSLEAVDHAAVQLRRHLRAEVDIEFALPEAGGSPVILQCRPLTALRPAPAGSRPRTAATVLAGRPCGGGRASGLAGDRNGAGIAVVERLTTADYGVVLGHAGVVAEHDLSPLSHVAILCRELGVPFVCGVEGARDRLAGRWITVDGGSGEIEVTDGPAAGSDTAAPGASGAATVTALELVVRLLAEGRPGADPAAEAGRLLQRYGRALGDVPVRLAVHPMAAADRARLEGVGVELFGPGFSVDGLLAALREGQVAGRWDVKWLSTRTLGPEKGRGR